MGLDREEGLLRDALLLGIGHRLADHEDLAADQERGPEHVDLGIVGEVGRLPDDLAARGTPARQPERGHEVLVLEVAFGTIGPSLYNFGKLRGYTADMQKYAYGKIYDSEAYNACTNMPRFGHKAILTEAQIRDVVALLMDPSSPVNK